MKLYISYIFFLLPFIVSFACWTGVLNDNSYVKQFAFGLAFAGMGLIALANKESWKVSQFQFKWADVFICVLFCIYIFFFKGLNNNLDLTLPFIYFLFYFFLRVYLQDNTYNIEATIVKIVPFIIAIHYVIIIMQYLRFLPNLHDFFPVGSTFGNPDKLAAYLSILFPFLYTKKKKTTFDVSILILGIILFFALQARTAIIATLLTFTLYLIFNKKISKKILLIGTVVGILAVILLVLWHPDSVSGRAFIWIVSSYMFLSKPLGWGLHAFHKNYLEIQTDFVAAHPTFSSYFNVDIVYSPFNEFLHIGVTLGAIGLLIYILFIMSVLLPAYRNKTVFIYPIIVFIIISFSYFPFKIAPIVVLLILFIVICVSLDTSSIVADFKYNIKAFPIILIMLIATGLTYLSFNSYSLWKKALIQQNSINVSNRGLYFRQAYNSLKDNGLFLASYSDYLYHTNNVKESLCLLERAETLYTSLPLCNYLAIIYESDGEIDKAKTQLQKAVAISGNRYSTTYELILFLIRIEKTEDAYSLAVELCNKPMDTYYIDSYIIKNRLQIFIDEYESSK